MDGNTVAPAHAALGLAFVRSLSLRRALLRASISRAHGRVDVSNERNKYANSPLVCRRSSFARDEWQEDSDAAKLSRGSD